MKRWRRNNFYGIKNKFLVIPNVVNVKKYSLQKSNTPSRNSKKKILLVGILTPRKGVNYLLEALNDLKNRRDDFFLDIVGDGPNKKEYEVMTQDFGLSEKVFFHGRQPEVVSFMQKCDFFVLPSLYENFGVVYIEAMACGTPAIYSDYGAQLEFASELGIRVKIKGMVPTKNILFQPDGIGEWCEPDFDHLKQVMRNVYENYEVYKVN